MYLIRVSTNSNLGKGHINRCIKIRNKIKSKVVWFIERGTKKELPNNLTDKIIEETSSTSLSKTIKYAIEYNAKAVIIDSPNIEVFKIESILGVKPIIIFVDKHLNFKNVLSVCMHPINIKRKNFLSGYKYLPLIKKRKNISIVKKSKNILVSFGNKDSKGLTENVVKIFQDLIVNQKFNLEEYKINIILGKYKKNKKHIKNTLAFNKNFRVFSNLSNLDIFYKKSGFAIGAPGFSQIERLEYNIPTILIAQNNIQKKLLDSWKDTGCALIAKNIQKDLKHNIALMIKKKEIRNNLIDTISSKFDGDGASRIFKEIKNYVNNFKSF